MTTPATTSTPPTATRPPVPSTSVRVGAIAALIGSLAFISTVVSSQGLSPREAFLLPMGVIGSVVASVGMVVLIHGLPRHLVPVPRWVSSLVLAALAFTLALTWFDASAIVGIATATSDAQFDAIGASTGVTVLFVPKAVLGLTGFTSLAVRGFRAGLFGRGSAALVGLGGLAFALPPFPPGLALVSAGLLLATAGGGLRTLTSEG